MENSQFFSVKRGNYESIGSPVLIIDPQTAEILDANEAACKLYGYSPTDFIQKTIIDLAALPAEEAWQRIRKIAEGEITRMSLQHHLASGEVRDVEVDLKRGLLNDKPVNIATIHDVTEERRTAYKLKERIKELNAFYSLAKILEEKWQQPEQLYQQVIDMLPQSWQYPEITYGRLTIN